MAALALESPQAALARRRSSSCAVVLLFFVVVQQLLQPVAAAAAAAAEGAAVVGEAAKEDVSHEYEALYLLFGFILVGAVVLQITSHPAISSVPATVIFFVLGIAFALLAEHSGFKSLPALMNSYTSWVSIDPHLLLFTFLPPLLFADAFAIDAHVALRTCGQCLVLAGPGVVIGSFASAAFFHYVLPYNWGWATSLMVGSILSATDPVAVVSMLKDLGASPVLTMQIQGESMLNDGTAMVLFTVAYGIVGKEECGVGCIFAYLVKSTLGAWALGTAIGLFFFWWIRGVSDKLSHRSSLIQILLTIACAYWSYLLADGIWQMSGVLSTVAAATTLANYMWPAVVEKKAMLEFWHVIETVGNTLVFFLAGLLTGESIPQHGFQDFMWAFVIYLGLMVIRLFTILVLWPLLNFSGDAKVSLRDIAVMTWGGLRGMVALALAILVRENRADDDLSELDGRRVLFLVGVVAALTLIINATTSPLLCGVLGITHTVEGRKALVRNVAKRAEADIKEQLRGLIASGSLPRPCAIGSVCEAVDQLNRSVHEHVFVTDGDSESFRRSGLDARFEQKHPLARIRKMSTMESIGMHRVTSFMSAPQPEPDIDDLWRRFEEAKMAVLRTHTSFIAFKFGRQLGAIRRLLLQPIDPQQLRIVREVFLEAVRASYWEQIEHGDFMVGTRVPNLLLNSVSLAKDRCGAGLMDWSFLERDVRFQPYSEASFEQDVARMAASASTNATGVKSSLSMFSSAGFRRCWHRFQLKRTLERQMKALHVATAFIKAHMQAQTEIASFFGASDAVDSAEEALVIVESQIQVFAATAMQGLIARPVQRYMCTTWESYRLCDRYRDFVHTAHAQGVLQGKEAEMLLEPVTRVMYNLSIQLRQMSDHLLGDGDVGKLYEVDAAVSIQRAFRRSRRVLPSGRDLPALLLSIRNGPRPRVEEKPASHGAALAPPTGLLARRSSSTTSSRGGGGGGICSEGLVPSDANLDLADDIV